MTFANMTKDELLRHSAFRLRENAKARGTMTTDHADCGCGGHGAARPTADAAAAVSRNFLDASNAAAASGIARINTANAARQGKTLGAPAGQAVPGFTADASTPGATGPGRYWTADSINTANAPMRGRRWPA